MYSTYHSELYIGLITVSYILDLSEWTSSNMEGSCEYIESSHRQPTRVGPHSLGVGRGTNKSSPLKRILLWNVHTESLGPGLILWIGTRHLWMR